MGIEIAIVLLLVGLAIIPIELFVPSGGALTALSVVSVIASVVCAFVTGTVEGVIFSGAAVVLTPGAWFLMIKVFPSTGMGKRVIMAGSELDEKGRKAGVALEYKALVGLEGSALTPLRPAGRVEIAGEPVDVVTDGSFVDQGARVRVIEVDTNRVVVQALGGG